MALKVIKNQCYDCEILIYDVGGVEESEKLKS